MVSGPTLESRDPQDREWIQGGFNCIPFSQIYTPSFIIITYVFLCHTCIFSAKLVSNCRNILPFLVNPLTSLPLDTNILSLHQAVSQYTPFLPYFDTQHLICKTFHFACRIFLIKAKKNILYWMSQILRPKSLFFNIFQKFLQKWTARTLFTIFWYPTPEL